MGGWCHDDGRHELTKIKGSRKQGHDRRGRILATLDAGDGVQIRHTNTIGYSDECRAENLHPRQAIIRLPLEIKEPLGQRTLA